MRILGHGLIAQALVPYAARADDAIAFAQGVSDSGTHSEAKFGRERAELAAVIDIARRDDRKLIYFSGGGAIYGEADGPGDEQAAVLPVTPYGRHQLACETMIRNARIRHLIARLPNLVGSRQPTWQLVPALVHQALHGEARIYDGATRDLIDVEDAMRLVAMLAERPEPHLTVNVASGVSTPVPALFEEIERILGTRARIEVVHGGESQRFAVGLIQALVPAVDAFPRTYPFDVLRRRVPDLAAGPVDVA